MIAEHEKYHRIDRFLRGELNSEELEAFERENLLNPDFAAEVEFQKEVNELISANSYHELREQMSKDIVEIDKKRNSFKYWLGGSLFLAAIMVAVYFYSANKEGKVKSEEKSKTKATNVPAKEVLKNKNGADRGNIKTNPHESLDHTQSEELKQNNNLENIEKNENPQHDENNSNIYNGSDKVKDPVIEDKHEEAKSNNPCSSVVITVPHNVEKSCANKSDGIISVNENAIAGGKGPYSIELYSGGTKVLPSEYEHLYAGNYSLKVSDVNGCESIWNLKVEEKPCKAKDIVISPAYGEKWEYDGKDGDSYYLSVFNQAGQLVYKSSLLIGSSEWTGINSSGATVDTGFYIYVVEYTNGKKETGQITVIR